MKTRIEITACVIVFTILLMLCGCKSTFHKAGLGFSEGAITGIENKNLDSIIVGIAGGLRNELLGDNTNELVDSLLTDLMILLKSNLDGMTASARDSLIGDKTAELLKKIVLETGGELDKASINLRENLLGARTLLLVQELRDELLGDKSIYALASIRDEMLGESTRAFLAALRNELLGEGTRSLVDSLISQSIAATSIGYRDDLGPLIKATLKDAENTVEGTVKYITWALGGLAAILALLAAFIWRKFSTRKKIMRILTQEINQIESQEEYDKLVKKINKRTTEEKLEESFKDILKEESLIEQKVWTNKDKLLLKDLTERINTNLSPSQLETMHQQLTSKGLNNHLKSIQDS